MRLREYYQAMPLKAISEEDRLHTVVGPDNNIRLMSGRVRDVSIAFAFNLQCISIFGSIYVLKPLTIDVQQKTMIFSFDN